MPEFGEEYPQRELFGGAIVSNIYQTFDDLSDIRPVRHLRVVSLTTAYHTST